MTVKTPAYKRWKRRYYAESAFAPRHGEPWKSSEEAAVLDHELTDRELSAKLGRSVSSIQKKRHLLKKGYPKNDL